MRTRSCEENSVPIHWGTFNLAFHAWDEPAERVVVAATAAGARLIMPRPGESIEPATAPPVKPWWRARTIYQSVER